MVQQMKGMSEKFRKIFRDDQLYRIFNYHPGHQIQWKQADHDGCTQVENDYVIGHVQENPAHHEGPVPVVQ